MDPLIAAHLEAESGSDEKYVDAIFRLVLRRPPDGEARERALEKLAAGTLSRATLVHELAASREHRRVRELDDAVASGLAARSRQEPLRWLTAPADTDERVIEIPWVLSRLREGRVLEIGYAFAEPAYLAALLRSGVDLVGADLADRELDGVQTVEADVRELPFPDASFDQVLLVSTLEHIGADNSIYGIADVADDSADARFRALRELRRVLRPWGSLLVTVPLGERGDHGWFRQDDVRGWTRLYTRTGFFVEEQEPYELTDGGWKPAPAFKPAGVRYGERGPAASAVLCTELSPSRLRRMLSPTGAARALKRRVRPLRHRGT